MRKVYLYGAGINCYGAIKFWKKENVVAVIDSNPQKWGTQIDGVNVISLNDYKRNSQGECIIITGFVLGDEIKKILIENSITNYYYQPYMQNGFPELSYLFEFYHMELWDDISILGYNPMTERIVEEAEKCGLVEKIKCIYTFPDLGNYSVDDCMESVQVKEYEGKCLDTSGIIITEMLGCKEVPVSDKSIRADVFSEEFCISFFPHEELREYKDIYKNQRCFVIGNGPSLRAEDLDVIYANKEISFGFNRISRIFDRTMWRPTYYMIDDFNAYKNDYLQYADMDGKNMFVREFYNLGEFPDLKKANRYHSTFQKLVDRKPDFSNDISRTVYWGATVTYSALQVAVYMGFSKIYLLGMDFNYQDRKIGGAGTHFSKEYEKGILFEVNYKREQELAYLSAREYTEKNGIKIYNATRGGELEVFERVKFDSLF